MIFSKEKEAFFSKSKSSISNQLEVMLYMENGSF